MLIIISRLIFRIIIDSKFVSWIKFVKHLVRCCFLITTLLVRAVFSVEPLLEVLWLPWVLYSDLTIASERLNINLQIKSRVQVNPESFLFFLVLIIWFGIDRYYQRIIIRPRMPIIIEIVIPSMISKGRKLTDSDTTTRRPFTILTAAALNSMLFRVLFIILINWFLK